MGINTGEVVTGTEERLATGDVATVAAPSSVAGRGGVLEPDGGQPEHRHDRVADGGVPARGRGGGRGERRTSVVGRERELTLIREAWAKACSGEACELLSVVGEAGVGKSRLIAEARLDDALGEGRHPHPLIARGYLLALLGRFEEARAVTSEQAERLRELRGEGHEAWLAWIARLEGDEERAAELFRAFCDSLAAHGKTGALSAFAAELAKSLRALGRHGEAEPLAVRSRELANEQDFCSQSLWRSTLALVHSDRAEHAEAARLAREAVAIADSTDSLSEQADALVDLAEVLSHAGCAEAAADALEQALDRYERKQSLVMAGRVPERLAATSGRR